MSTLTARAKRPAGPAAIADPEGLEYILRVQANVKLLDGQITVLSIDVEGSSLCPS